MTTNFRELLEVDTFNIDICNKIDENPSYRNIPTGKKKIPWVDKYRPKKLNEIVYQDEVIKILKQTVKDGNLPHLLFHGPPGTGKTSTILAIAYELFGPIKFKERVIELNASDERGIGVVRGKIATFAQTAIGTADPNYPCPGYKIIILDEADAMTTEAQAALRKTIENNSSITRFCFICNYINQIIEPINSRCAKFRFKPLSEECMFEKLKKIIISEKLEVDNKTILAITNISEGDLRKGIMLLQNLKYINNNNIIKEDDVYAISGRISDSMLNRVINICINKNTGIPNILELTHEIKSYSYPIQNILNQISDRIIHHNNLTDKMKSQICIILAKSEKMLIDGADEFIQLLNIFIQIKYIANKKN